MSSSKRNLKQAKEDNNTGGCCASSQEKGASNNKRNFVPLESNPETLNLFLNLIGFDTSRYHFVDVLSTDDWALDLIPQPVLAILLVCPSKRNDVDGLEEVDDDDTGTSVKKKIKIWHASQTIGGVCGSLAVLHAIANLPQELSTSLPYIPDSWLDVFLQQYPADEVFTNSTNDLLSTSGRIRTTSSRSSIRNGMALHADSEFEKMHHAAALSLETNQTQHSNYKRGIKVGTHFVAYITSSTFPDNDDDGSFGVDSQSQIRIIEMDGRKPGPILHDKTNPVDFLRQTCSIVEKVMQRNNSSKFCLLALARNKNA